MTGNANAPGLIVPTFGFAFDWTVHGFPALLFALALLGGLSFLALRRRSPTWGYLLLLVGAALACFAAGGLLVPPSWGWWVVGGAGVVLAVLAVVLVLTGAWWSVLAYLVAAAALLGLGGLGSRAAGDWLADAGVAVVGLRFKSPWWLFLLLLVPLFVMLGYRRLWRGEWRPWAAMVLRCALVTGVSLALAEPYLAQPNRNLTVLFVLDRSLSIPEEPGDDPAVPGSRADLRWMRIRKFINDAVQKRGAGHERDMAGLVVFARRPRLELPPSDAPRFNLQANAPPVEDGSHTDIGSALKLALASFPEGTSKRIVLITDGNENLGSAEEQARLAKSLNVQIDVLPLAAGQRNEDEVMVERVDAPPIIEKGAVVPITVLVRSHNPNIVAGRLTLRQITDKEARVTLPVGEGGDIGIEVADAGKSLRITKVEARSAASRAGLEEGDQVLQLDGTDVSALDDRMVPASRKFADALARKKPKSEVTLALQREPVKVVAERDNVKLRFGLNSFSFDRPQSEDQRSYSYEAVFEPLRVEDATGHVLKDKLPGDRVQNNRASAHVVARGQGRVLLLENEAGAHKELVSRLTKQGKGRFQVVAEPVDILDNFKDRDKLAVFLSNFDCVILANVPRERVSDEQQEVIRANTQDQGCGLVMIGGPDSFGAGGWQKTPVEAALPVDCDIKSLKVSGKGGLVLIMHASEMADGNRWQKKIGKLAVERLGPNDKVGVIDFDFNCKWVVDFQEVGPNRAKILKKIDEMMPGDMPDFDPALQMAHDALVGDKDLATRHIIIISDGDPVQNNANLLKAIRAAKITVTTVGVATHGAPQDQALANIASPKTAQDMARPRIKGEDARRKYYKVDDPKTLPAIYTREARLVSQSFVQKKHFDPVLAFRSGPTAKLERVLPLEGFVRTTPKPSPLVEVPIVTPPFADQEFPILAYWHYGLGKSVAFTSDAGQPEFWARAWAEGGPGGEGIFASFWESVIAWALRPVESGKLQMHTEYRDGKIKVTVEARTQDGKPDTGLRLRGGITTPGKGPGPKQELRFVQKNVGLYEAEVKADEAGSYFVTAQADRVRKVKGRDGKDHEEVEKGVDGVRAGVTLPYSPEFSDLETNTPLLERLASMTGGEVYEDDALALEQAVKSGEVFRPVPQKTRSSLPFYHWLLFLAGGLLLCDVAVRRLAFDSAAVGEKLDRVWARLRGRPLPPPGPAAVDRMRPRKLGEGIQSRGARRYEGGPVMDVPGIADATAPRPAAGSRPAARPGVPEPTAEQPAGDYADRLMQAKRRALERKDKKEKEE